MVEEKQKRKIKKQTNNRRKKKSFTHTQIGIWQFNGNLSTVIEQNSHKMVKFISMETGSRTPLSAAHWYTPAWWRSTRSSISVELSDKCVDPEKISCTQKLEQNKQTKQNTREIQITKYSFEYEMGALQHRWIHFGYISTSQHFTMGIYLNLRRLCLYARVSCLSKVELSFSMISSTLADAKSLSSQLLSELSWTAHKFFPPNFANRNDAPKWMRFSVFAREYILWCSERYEKGTNAAKVGLSSSIMPFKF